MTKTYKIFTGLIVIALALLAFSFSPRVFGSITNRISANNVKELQTYSFFSATTTSATSTNLSAGGGFLTVSGAKKIDFYFTHGGTATTSTATSTFSVQFTPDGTNWYDYSKLVTSTSSAVVATVPIVGATSTVIANISTILTDTFYGLRCIALEGTTGRAGGSGDGEHTCTAQAEF